jgi:hypothetical protein
MTNLYHIVRHRREIKNGKKKILITEAYSIYKNDNPVLTTVISGASIPRRQIRAIAKLLNETK